MSSNRFGKHFSITTWGESHGKAIGVVIDGCPAGLAIDEGLIQQELDLRRPGRNAFVTPRIEEDRAEILSGVFEGRTTGAPISIMIPNRNQDSSPYDAMKNIYRPGHSNFTYLEKYGVFDHRGGGRSSGRETACRVAAGAVAKALLCQYEIKVTSYLASVGEFKAEKFDLDPKASPIFCPDKYAQDEICDFLEKIIKEGDSIGGSIITKVEGLKPGLGEPLYEKMEAVISLAVLSIPAIKGIYFGETNAHLERGSAYQDVFELENDRPILGTNHCGGILGGISTGSPLIFTAWCKPPSSIKIPLRSVTTSHKEASFQIPHEGKHDPCIAIRAVPVIEAMTALTLADFVLAARLSRI